MEEAPGGGEPAAARAAAAGEGPVLLPVTGPFLSQERFDLIARNRLRLWEAAKARGSIAPRTNRVLGDEWLSAFIDFADRDGTLRTAALRRMTSDPGRYSLVEKEALEDATQWAGDMYAYGTAKKLAKNPVDL
jgi:hypothetical protein